jgi:DNA helicase-2/ATP-dependent DNA helicase PcrA
LRTPDEYDAYLGKLERREIPLPRMAKSKDAIEMSDDEILGRCREVARAFRFTEKLLQDEGLGTFGHIMSRAVDVLMRRKSVLERAQKRARFILIDEFQDSNVAQIKLASLLAGDEANVFAVGDPDQAIYQFRGATSGAFDQFLQTFGADRVKRVTMSANRRSTPAILGCAYEAIKPNPAIVSLDRDWTRQPLLCARLEREPQLAVARAVQAIAPNSHEQEATFVADTIQEMRQQNPDLSYGKFAVLYRSHKNRELLVAELTRRGIPIKVKGADLLHTPELRDAMAILRILDASHPVMLFRVAALPQFHIDPERFRAELALFKDNFSAEAALQNVAGGPEVLARIREAHAELASQHGDVTAAINIAQRFFGLPETMPLRRLRDFAERWSKKPTQIVGEHSLHEFLGYLDYFIDANGTLVEESDEDDPVAALAPNEVGNAVREEAVQLMTVHAAKGLEFPHVFVIRVASNCFPASYKESLVEFPPELRTKSASDGSDPKTQHGQEERRLFYVAMTRAMDELYICGKASSLKKQLVAPSKFMRELVNLAGTSLKDFIAFRVLEPETIPQMQAAAEPALNVSQWTQIPARQTGRALELSASAIQQYEMCPLSYKLRYDWKLPEDASAALQFGNAMHLALKAYFDGVRAGRAPDEETLIACFLDEFSKAKIDEQVQRDMYTAYGREQLTALVRSQLGQPDGEILETERRFKIEVEGALVKGRLDRLDRLPNGEVAVIDYKTGKAKTQDDADDSLQLSIYALAAKSLGHTPASMVFINLSNGTAVASKRSENDLRDAEKKIVEIASKIDAGDFEPKKSGRCPWCSYNSICPEQEEPLPRPALERAATVH